MKTNERLNKAVNYLKLAGLIKNNADVAQKMGATPANVSRSISGSGNNPTRQFLRRFCRAFDCINEEWLADGKGEMLNINGGAVAGNGNGSIVTGDNNLNGVGASVLVKAIDEISKMRELVELQVRNNQSQFNDFMELINKLK